MLVLVLKILPTRKPLSCDVKIPDFPLLVETDGGKDITNMAAPKTGASSNTVFIVKWMRHELSALCSFFFPLNADVKTMIHSSQDSIVHCHLTLIMNVHSPF